MLGLAKPVQDLGALLGLFFERGCIATRLLGRPFVTAQRSRSLDPVITDIDVLELGQGRDQTSPGGDLTLAAVLVAPVELADDGDGGVITLVEKDACLGVLWVFYNVDALLLKAALEFGGGAGEDVCE